jgi:hypothetical protein
MAAVPGAGFGRRRPADSSIAGESATSGSAPTSGRKVRQHDPGLPHQEGCLDLTRAAHLRNLTGVRGHGFAFLLAKPCRFTGTLNHAEGTRATGTLNDAEGTRATGPNPAHGARSTDWYRWRPREITTPTDLDRQYVKLSLQFNLRLKPRPPREPAARLGITTRRAASAPPPNT